MIHELLSTLPVERLGRVLVHFVWQGALVAALLALSLYALRRRAASLRYAVALAALFVMAALPVTTWILLAPPTAPPAEVSSAVASLPTLTLDEPARVVALPEPSLWAQARSGFDAALPWLVAGWLLGVAVLSVRLAGGWATAQRLRWRGRRLVGPAWTRRFDELARRLRVPEGARLVVSTAVEGPMTLGWWRPLVLVPAGVLTGLPPEQVEAILAHELAHIRRHDYLVGLAQSAVETLLFYHPAVWWVSRRVRVLREHCCDDLATAACADRLTYARALTALEGWRPGPRPALSAAGSALGERVRRLVGASSPSERRRPGVVLVALLFVAAACAVGGQGWAAESPDPSAWARLRVPLQADLSAVADTTEPDSARVRVFVRPDSHLVHLWTDSLRVFYQPDSLGRALSVSPGPEAYVFDADSLFGAWDVDDDGFSGAWAFDVEEGPDLDSLVTFSLRRADSALQRIDWPALQERTLRAQFFADSALASIDWPDVQAEIQQGQNQAVRLLKRFQQRRDTIDLDSLIMRRQGNTLNLDSLIIRSEGNALNLDSLLQRYHRKVRREDEAMQQRLEDLRRGEAGDPSMLEKLLRQEDRIEAQEEARQASEEARTEARRARAEALEGTVERLRERAEQLDEQGHAEAARAVRRVLREESRRLDEQRRALREQDGSAAQALREQREALEREILDLKQQSRALEREAGRLERERDALREEEDSSPN